MKERRGLCTVISIETTEKLTSSLAACLKGKLEQLAGGVPTEGVVGLVDVLSSKNGAAR